MNVETSNRNVRDLNVGTSRKGDVDVEGKKTPNVYGSKEAKRAKAASPSKTATYRTVSCQFIEGQKLKPQNVSLIDEEEAPRRMPEGSDSYVTNPNEEGTKITSTNKSRSNYTFRVT